MSDRRFRWLWLLPTFALVGWGLTAMLASFARHALYPAPNFTVGEPPAGFTEASLPLSGGDQVVLWASPDRGRDRPLVLFFHGNGENLASLDLGGTFQRFATLGVTVAAIDYPGYGRSTGSASEDSLREAGRAAIDWATSRFPEHRLVVVGWSLGAAVAIASVSEVSQDAGNPVDALIAMSPWASLPEVANHLFPAWLVRMILEESYDSERSAREIAVPALVVHGESDELIPADHGRRIAAALQGKTEALFVPAGHNDLLGQPRVWQEIGRFLDRVSKPSDAEALSLR